MVASTVPDTRRSVVRRPARDRLIGACDIRPRAGMSAASGAAAFQLIRSHAVQMRQLEVHAKHMRPHQR